MRISSTSGAEAMCRVSAFAAIRFSVDRGDGQRRRFLPERYACPRQHALPSCIGGHFTVPYEQNTQQSPDFGRSNAPHAAQSWKKMQASVGMLSVDAWPHCGHVSVDSRIISADPSRR
jgi:hypothetical protein